MLPGASDIFICNYWDSSRANPASHWGWLWLFDSAPRKVARGLLSDYWRTPYPCQCIFMSRAQMTSANARSSRSRFSFKIRAIRILNIRATNGPLLGYATRWTAHASGSTTERAGPLSRPAGFLPSMMLSCFLQFSKHVTAPRSWVGARRYACKPARVESRTFVGPLS